MRVPPTLNGRILIQEILAFREDPGRQAMDRRHDPGDSDQVQDQEPPGVLASPDLSIVEVHREEVEG